MGSRTGRTMTPPAGSKSRDQSLAPPRDGAPSLAPPPVAKPSLAPPKPSLAPPEPSLAPPEPSLAPPPVCEAEPRPTEAESRIARRRTFLGAASAKIHAAPVGSTSSSISWPSSRSRCRSRSCSTRRRGASRRSSAPTSPRSTCSRATATSSCSAATSASRSGARGTVRLSVGEGITGMAVECMRPISVVQARRARALPRLPRARRGSLPGLPRGPHPRPPARARRARRAARRRSGLRRRATSSSSSRSTAPIAAGIRHAQLLDERRERGQARRTGGGTRKVTLPGVPIVARPRARRDRGAAPARRASPQRKGERRRSAAAPAPRSTSRARRSARCVARGRARRSSDEARVPLDLPADGRRRAPARARLRARSPKGRSVAQALGHVAREAARAANGIVGDPFLQDRARDIEDLCDALLMLAAPDARAELPSKARAPRRSAHGLRLCWSRRGPARWASRSPSAPRARAPQVLLQLMGVPAIVDVGGRVPLGVAGRRGAARRRSRLPGHQPVARRGRLALRGSDAGHRDDAIRPPSCKWWTTRTTCRPTTRPGPSPSARLSSHLRAGERRTP